MRKCSKCGVEKPETEFYANKRTASGFDYYCKECRKEQAADNFKKNDYSYNRSNREFVESLKSPCDKCGEDRLYLIQFHHVDPKEKLFMLSAPSSRSRTMIAKEASKCVCLCSNCHDEFHYLYGKRPEKPVESLLKYIS